MTNLEKLHELMYDIAEDIDKEENLAEFKRILKEEKEKGLDLNDEITTHYCVTSETYYYPGNLSQNWQKLYEGNWNGSKYAAHIEADDMYSQTIHDWLTSEGDIEIARAIYELYPDYEAEDKDSIFLGLKDILDQDGYIKIQMLDDRYLVTKEEQDRLWDWLDDHEENPEAEYTIKATDILTDEEVHYLIKADQRDNFVDHNCNLDWCEIERI